MNARFIGGLVVLVIGLLLSAAGLGLLVSPIRYRATAQIKIELDTMLYAPNQEVYQPYDPYFFQTEIKIMESAQVLSNVVQALDLDEVWGKRYNHGGTMATDEAVPLLRRRTEIKSPSNTRLVEISVWDENPTLAAQIADGIVKAYDNYRIEQRRRLTAAGLELLKKSYQEETGEITNKEAQLAQLKRQSGITNPEPADDVLMKQHPDYYAAKRALVEKENFHALLKAKIESIRNDWAVPQPLVVVVNRAEDSTVARSQNHLWGAVSFICGVGLSTFGYSLLRRNGKTVSVTGA